MNTRIHMHIKVLFPTGSWENPGVGEMRFVATKEVELLEIPKAGRHVQDGSLTMQLYQVDLSVSGPRFICHADYGHCYGWNDMGGVPGYYGLVRDAVWFTMCERLGWTLAPETGRMCKPDKYNHTYQGYP